MKNQNYKTLAELEDRYFGKLGSPEREQYEFELSIEILGERLKNLRRDKKLTQEQLGRIIGVKKSQISMLERGTNAATISTVLRVFHALRIKVKFEIEIEDSPEFVLQ